MMPLAVVNFKITCSHFA